MRINTSVIEIVWTCKYRDYVVTDTHTHTHKPTTITLRLRARVNNIHSSLNNWNTYCNNVECYLHVPHIPSCQFVN